MRDDASFPIVGGVPTEAAVSAVTLDGLAVEGAVTEAELAKRLAEGAAIRDAVVVYRRPQLVGGGVFTPYLRIAGRSGFLALATYRDKSIRSYKDFSRLMAALDGWGYRGPVRVLWDDDPDIPRLQLTGAVPPAE